MEYLNRRYVIFDVSELPKIDFSEVFETSSETVRKSVDGTKTFVKWEYTNEHVDAETGESIVEEYIPESIVSLTTKSEYYTHEEILEILAGEDWTPPNPGISSEE